MKEQKVKLISPNGMEFTTIWPSSSDPEFKRAVKELQDGVEKSKKELLKAHIGFMEFPSATISAEIFDYYSKLRMLDSGSFKIKHLPPEITRSEAINRLEKHLTAKLSEILFPFVRGSIAHYLTTIESSMTTFMERISKFYDEKDTHVIDHSWIDDKSFWSKLECLKKYLRKNNYLEESYQSSKFLKGILEVLTEVSFFRNKMSHPRYSMSSDNPLRLEFYDDPRTRNTTQFIDLDYETAKFLVKYLWKLSYVMEMIPEFKLSEIERLFQNKDFKSSHEFVLRKLTKFKSQIKTSTSFDEETGHLILHPEQ